VDLLGVLSREPAQWASDIAVLDEAARSELGTWLVREWIEGRLEPRLLAAPANQAARTVLRRQLAAAVTALGVDELDIEWGGQLDDVIAARWCWIRPWSLMSQDEDLLLMADDFVAALLGEASAGCPKRDYAISIVQHHVRDQAHAALARGSDAVRSRLHELAVFTAPARAASASELVAYLERLASYARPRKLTELDARARILDLGGVTRPRPSSWCARAVSGGRAWTPTRRSSAGSASTPRPARCGSIQSVKTGRRRRGATARADRGVARRVAGCTWRDHERPPPASSDLAIELTKLTRAPRSVGVGDLGAVHRGASRPSAQLGTKMPVGFVAGVFIFTLSHGMVTAAMRTRFDQFGKQMVRTTLETRGPVETGAEVPADTRRIDLWFMPDPARSSAPDQLGVLGRIAGGPSTPLLWSRLVVVNELPVDRDTLLVRLLGAGAMLKQAITELKELRAEAPERTLALPILVRLRLTVPSDRAKQTADDQEFLMDTQDIVETWRREAIQEGVQEGIKQGVQEGVKQGIAHSLIEVYEARFGALPEDLRMAVEDSDDEPTLVAWLRLAGTRSADQIAAAIRSFRAS
jgi:hypothetical protein